MFTGCDRAVPLTSVYLGRKGREALFCPDSQRVWYSYFDLGLPSVVALNQQLPCRLRSYRVSLRRCQLSG